MLQARQEAVERIARSLTAAGFPRLPARMFAALLTDDDGRMTAAEVGELLEVSAGAVSGAVRYLTLVGLVHRERERGSRRDVYVVDDDAWHGAMMRKDQLYGPIRAALDWALGNLGDDTPARTRLRVTREFLAFLEAEFDALGEKWERRKAEVLAEEA